MDGYSKDQYTGERGKEISSYDWQMLQMKYEENRIARREKSLDADMKDLVEYVKWVTNDLGVLRDRVRIAEKIISDLRWSGEESVESLLNNLYSQSTHLKLYLS